MKKIIMTMLLVVCFSLNSSAKYVQSCIVRYMTEEGWSKKYNVDVTFISGSELNEATGTFNYAPFSTYATIFWGEGKASVIKRSTFLPCGTTIEKSCIANSVTDLKGKDQDEDEWKICVSNYCF